MRTENSGWCVDSTATAIAETRTRGGDSMRPSVGIQLGDTLLTFKPGAAVGEVGYETG